MANNVDPDETARYGPSHLDLHCLQRYPCWSAEMKGLNLLYYNSTLALSSDVSTHFGNCLIVYVVLPLLINGSIQTNHKKTVVIVLHIFLYILYARCLGGLCFVIMVFP